MAAQLALNMFHLVLLGEASFIDYAFNLVSQFMRSIPVAVFHTDVSQNGLDTAIYMSGN